MKNRNNRYIQMGLIVFLGLIILVGLAWVNYTFSKGNPGGNDFLVHYIGARSLLYDGLSPYSDEVAVRIQTAAYGHPAQGIEHELRVAYPLYSVFLFTPFAVIGDYNIARAIWMTCLEIALIAMSFLALNLTEWNPPLWLQGLILLFSIIWYHAIRGLINGNVVILIALAISAILLSIKKEHDKIAGILLAAVTIKPHIVVLFIAFVLIWSLYKGRWILLQWFVGTLFVLVVISVLIIPDWIIQNIQEVLRYPGYNPAGTLAAALGELLPGLGQEIKWVIALIFGMILIYEWWIGRKEDFTRFMWVSFMTLVISQWIGIQTDPGNFIILFPALILILSVWEKRWENKGLLLTGISLAVLFFGLWLLFLVTIQRSYQPVQNPIMFIPLPAVLLIGLYWIKWWVNAPVRMLWVENNEN